ncbi:MAG: hypothetical protein AAF561_03135 [Planctomycetota bacterium]
MSLFDPEAARKPTASVAATCPQDGDVGQWLFAFQRRRRRRAARRAKRNLKALVHQQFWCWGMDIGYPCGNQLLREGFTRHRRTDGGTGGTCYTSTGGDLDLWLWGFGLVAKPRGGCAVLLRRYEMQPLIVRDIAGLQSLHGLPDVVRRASVATNEHERSEVASARAILFRWIAGYERRIVQHAGADWRERVVAAMEHVMIPAVTMAAAWEETAASLAPSPTTSSSVVPVGHGHAVDFDSVPPRRLLLTRRGT